MNNDHLASNPSLNQNGHSNEFSAGLLVELSETHLLKHPYYQLWNEGKLTKESLQDYARQYFHHVDAFPRYISATHSTCTDIKARQVLLDNLIDEERGEENHPELWLRFAEGMGASRQSVLEAELLPETKELISTFMTLSRSSYPEGLGALFAYEQQVPEVAATKIEGLEKFYSVKDEETLKFFKVHLEADVYHSRAVAEMMDQLNEFDRARARSAALKAGQALWRFLDGVYGQIAA